ncbi:Outer membrane lipoprotein GNA33, membrane-bound lytic murein transglycosylase [Polymorphum gilvum SL003B-26A1]|uniref:peptidoglycan lytic exotransglycosylase n=2 Tax=Polymorphum TaxID=991903 RepID=F2IVF1_POLGS|nr:Outer membrane lipoprotein GNA33, membrane-bound lytic murein transglycosylase [Polymorphum gilvum SL003B-26A1]
MQADDAPLARKIAFEDLAGWADDDHAAALAAFLRFCGRPEPATGAFGIAGAALLDLCNTGHAAMDGGPDAARRFFEAEFVPVALAAPGFVTGYFEPELAGSRVRTREFQVPLLRAPQGLERVDAGNRPDGWDDGLSHGRRTPAGLAPLPDRGAIMDGALAGEGLELVWLADPLDAFFVHVQGSARIRLPDGDILRVGYAGKTGHAYTSIARVLVERGEGAPEDFTMDGLRAWLRAHPAALDPLLRQNRSYIFFREVGETGADQGPVGAAGLPLVPGRSLAVDSQLHTYGTPIFISADLAAAGLGDRPFRRLMVADDTGSAIRGPGRGDLFIGSGTGAGDVAGHIRHRAEVTLLVPRSAAGPLLEWRG